MKLNIWAKWSKVSKAHAQHCFTIRWPGGRVQVWVQVQALPALGAVFRHSLGWLDWRAQTQGIASATDLKRIETPHSLCCDFGGFETFTTRWSGGRVQVWVQVWAAASHLQISPKAVPEGNRRFREQNQQPSSWGRLLARVGRASTNTERFWVGSSRWGKRSARLRKTCYHTCDTDSVQESTRF